MQCPYCGNTETTFLRRTRWAKFIPGFEYYDCSNCGGTHSRLFIRLLHSFFIAIVTFLITLAMYWLKIQNTPSYYREVEQYIAAISRPAKVSGPIDDFSVLKKDASPQMTKLSPVETPKHDGTSISHQTPPVSELLEKSIPVDSEPKENIYNIHKEKPKIKVLIGNKRRSSAEKIAVQLDRIGYTIDRIDVAPRSNFQQLTIYYKEGFKVLAHKLGRQLGDDFIDKKLSWASQFDLILVTGENE